MANTIVLTPEEFTNALLGGDRRFVKGDNESGNPVPGVMIFMQNIRVEENLTIGMNKKTSSWNGPPLSFNNRIRIENAVFHSIDLYSVVFHRPIFFSNNVVIEGDFNIRGGEYNTVFFDDVTVKKALRIMGAKLHYIRFFGGEFSSIHMTSLSVKYLQIYPNARIKQLDIINAEKFGVSKDHHTAIYYLELSLPDEVIVNVDRFEISRLKLKGSMKSNTIIFKDLTIGELFVDKFFSRGNNTIILSNIKPLSTDSILSFTNSYLGNFVFFDVDFKSFNTLNILHSNLTDCIFNNVIWPNNIKVYDIKDLGTDYKTVLVKVDESIEQTYSKQRENYRQLKHASSKQGDRAQELLFHSKEMKALRKSSNSLDVNNKPILWLSYLSNNHGLNWVYPALWLFVIGAVFTLSIIHASGPNNTPSHLDHALVLPFSLHTIILYWDWSIYFAILNPTHRLEAIGEQVHNLNSAVVALDFFSRVFIAFLIYQVIVAFRKFNR